VHDTVLFDLDGTLIDSIELIRRSFVHAHRVHLGVVPDEREFVSGLGRPLRWQFAQVVEDPAEVEAMIATYREFNLAHHDELVTVYPGAVEAVARLAERGARLAIVTSKLHASAERGLVHCGFDLGLFGAIVGVDDVTEHKPHPQPVLRALELLGADAAGAVMVGDSPHDLAAGRAAGTRTGAVAWGPFPHAELRATAPDVWLATPPAIAHL
jgi:pyrophosphatase PpaX